MSELKQQNYVKVTKNEKDTPRYSHNWSLAKRAFFKVYENKLKIGSSEIEFPDIRSIVLYKTKQFFIPAPVLSIETQDGNYQIGFSPWVNPIKNIPLEVKTETVKLEYSIFSIIVRLILVVLFIGWLYLEFS